MSNFIDYSKTKNKDLSQVGFENSTGNSTGGDSLLTNITVDTISDSEVSLEYTKSSSGSVVNYNINQALPSESNIVKKDVVFRGKLNGDYRFISGNTNLTRKVSIDNKFTDVEMTVNVEYEYDNSYFTVNQLFKLDDVDTVSKKLQIQEKVDLVKNQDELVKVLSKQVEALNKRVSDLESIVNA